jgi:glycosyltransferase involved in cell wall biosynthesis
VFVLPSRDEPLGVVILEAMSYGLPVICSDTAGVQWCIERGGNGYVFKSDDADDLALALRGVVLSPGAIESMGRRSLELVASRHSPERYFESLMAAIHGAGTPPS